MSHLEATIKSEDVKQLVTEDAHIKHEEIAKHNVDAELAIDKKHIETIAKCKAEIAKSLLPTNKTETPVKPFLDRIFGRKLNDDAM